MKIRTGFVTNSSSTNFLILSRKELTCEFLLKELGFNKLGPAFEEGYELVHEMLRRINDMNYWSEDMLSAEKIGEEFGESSKSLYLSLSEKGWYAYIGTTDSSTSELVTFFTTDSGTIKTKNLFIDARQCIW